MNSSALIPVDAAGRRLALTWQGHGTPAVVLETGMGAESDEWETVQQGVASFAQVYRYDRANRGSSDPAPKPRSVQDAADDLHMLVQAAAIPTPFVLVGHSLGGMIARLYAYQHPGDVAGLVLVDPAHEDQFERTAPLLPPPFPGEPAGLTNFRQFWTTGWRDPANNAEGIDFVLSQTQAHTIDTLGDLPLLLLRAGALRLIPPNHPLRDQLGALRKEMMLEIARQLSRSRMVLVEDSDHFIQREQPQAVVAAIREIVETVQSSPHPADPSAS